MESAMSACLRNIYADRLDTPTRGGTRRFLPQSTRTAKSAHGAGPQVQAPMRFLLAHVVAALYTRFELPRLHHQGDKWLDKHPYQWSQIVGAGGPHHAPMWEHTQSSAPCRCVPHFLASISRFRLLSQDRKFSFCQLRVKVARSRRQI